MKVFLSWKEKQKEVQRSAVSSSWMSVLLHVVLRKHLATCQSWICYSKCYNLHIHFHAKFHRQVAGILYFWFSHSPYWNFPENYKHKYCLFFFNYCCCWLYLCFLTAFFLFSLTEIVQNFNLFYFFGGRKATKFSFDCGTIFWVQNTDRGRI